MTINLENSLKNRDQVIKNVKEEIIGPLEARDDFLAFNPIGNTIFTTLEEAFKPYYWNVGGKKEEILQRETPTQRYVSGQLYPIGTLTEDGDSIEAIDINTDDVSIDHLYNESNELESTESVGDIELFPQKNDYMPSSMGLTFCIDKRINTLKVVLSGGTYTPHKIKVSENGKSYEWWIRESLEGSLFLDLDQIKRIKQKAEPIELLNAKGEKAGQYSFNILVRLREFESYYIITVSATNNSSKVNLRKEQMILFQAEMAVKTMEKEYFSTYPKQFEMKDNLQDEEAYIELLYRKEGIYALGHGCAADWDQNTHKISCIKTTFIPQYETISMTPDVETKNGPLKIMMGELAGLSSNKHPKEIVKPLLVFYEEWISQKEKEIRHLPKSLQNVAYNHLEKCRDSLQRIERGYELLEEPKVLRAFQLANLAILLQQVNGTSKRTGQVVDNDLKFNKDITSVVKDETQLKKSTNSWRAFQIAFFLMSIDSLVNPSTSDDREIVDLIWFPTGGGKTEAYLGVAAFQMLYRRLQNPDDAGVDIMMRYTLRLLTADQFQRSSRLICALDYIRQKNLTELGDIPFSIGIWVGSKTTPNKNAQAKIMLRNLEKNQKNAQTFVVHNCPWCGAKLGHYPIKGKKDAIHFGYKIESEKLKIHCPDKQCHFYKNLPIHIVDETIYEQRPTFLIGTIDKFVQLVWEPRSRALFGINKEGDRFVNPPGLIIQDELHLISGPLGSLTGLFEVLIEELCLQSIDDQIVKPKIIAATATIKLFEEQAQALFGRKKEARLFPSPGLEYDDSFFASPAKDKNGNLMPGRKYVGVYTNSVKIMMAQVMSFSAILQSLNEIEKDERDPYWTLLAFYNTIRELGGGLTLTQTDIPQYSKAISMRKGRGNQIRFINNTLELTSRKQSHEISKTLDDLKLEYNSGSKKERPIDLCLASNIIEVGVDIDRLSVMAIVGQPKMTAQYIQVSGRVGRKWWERPGVIFTIYSNTKTRDKSHFEHFREYHQKLYAQVEPTSVTPFSDACLDRGLKAIIIGFLRQALSSIVARTPDWDEINKQLQAKVLPFFNRLIERVELIDPEQVDDVKYRFRDVLEELKYGEFTSWSVGAEVKGYMYSAGSHIPLTIKNESQSMMNSMRNVDAECRGLIVSEYESVNKKGDQSLEEMFS